MMMIWKMMMMMIMIIMAAEWLNSVCVSACLGAVHKVRQHAFRGGGFFKLLTFTDIGEGGASGMLTSA